MSVKYLEPIKSRHVGCLCCPGNVVRLPLDTVLYNGFGGWTITRNDEFYFMDKADKEWEDFKTLQYIEDIAQKEPDEDWRAEIFLPLRGATYQRQNGEWVLVQENQGFA